MRRSVLLAVLAICACKTAPPRAPVAASTPAPAATAAPAMPAGLDAAAMDPKADPCDDFFAYACGGWLANTEIPADRSGWSRGFTTIQERNQQILKGMLESIAAGNAPDGTPYAKQLGDYYATCMDEAKLESSLPELRRALNGIQAIRTPRALAAEVGRLQRSGAHILFDFGPTQDAKDATQVIGGFGQAGLGLPDRDYYLKDDAKTKEIRTAYQGHVAKVFALLGDKPAAAEGKANQILALETVLAKASLDRVSRRDPAKTYHRVERKGLKKLARGFDWNGYLSHVGAPSVQAITVESPEFFTEVGAQARQTPLNVWKAYVTFHLVNSKTEALPKAFQDEKFAFESKNLSGAKEDLPRWKKCVASTDDALGEAIGVPFVLQTFGEDGKKTTKAMVAGIEQAFEVNLRALTWMDDGTKVRAREKAEKIFNKIGFPDKWKTYDGLQTDRSSFLANIARTNAYDNRRELAKIGKPLDRSLWMMTPPTVNAYYNPSMNEIVFPAGILQPPFFNREATAEVNFGAMGMVVGHEITHGFDDEGRHFDAVGNLTDWWTPASDKAFTERVACVKTQFDVYQPLPGVHLNGALTLGENTADLGGLRLAYAAMQAARQSGMPGTESGAAAARFTPEQQFFLGFAQSWCGKDRDERARVLAATNPHSPARFRVNGPLSNLSTFQQAFSCKEGQSMVRKGRCEVW